MSQIEQLATIEGVRATLSPCGAYRYFLSRRSEVAHPDRGTALFVMLNPSTADASQDDPTIRRCRRFGRDWGCAGIAVANLYAYRATNPRELNHCPVDPVGSNNDLWLRRLALEYGDVVCAWGANAGPDRVKQVVRIFQNSGAQMWCLGTTKSGAPRHPLYVKASQPLIPWAPESEEA